jgi:hypothetical protein
MDFFTAILFALAALFFFANFKKKKEEYIKIDENGVEWFLDGFSQPSIRSWEEIKRIKFEDKGVALYQQSSFCDFISFQKLNEADSKEVKAILTMQYTIN